MMAMAYYRNFVLASVKPGLRGGHESYVHPFVLFNCQRA